MSTSRRSTWPRWARTATSPWLLSPVLVLALLVGAFVGYGAWTRAHPTHYGRGGVFGASAAAPAVVGSAPTPTDSAAPSTGAPAPAAVRAKASPSAAGRSSSGPEPPATASASVPAAATPAPAHAGGSRAAVVTPAVGTYELHVTGSEHVKFGPFSACSNAFPADSSLVVQRAAGEPNGSYDFDQRFFPASANKHDERHIYRYSSSAVVLGFEQATVTCSGVKQSTTVDYSPAQTRVRLPLQVGAGWSSRGGDANRTEAATSKVTGTSRVSVAGRSYLVYVIDTHIDMTGSESGTRDQTWWYAPSLGVPLRWHEALSGSRSGATYSADYTCEVTATP